MPTRLTAIPLPLALLVAISPAVLALDPAGVDGVDSCPGVSIREIRLTFFQNGSVAVEIGLRVCVRKGQEYPVEFATTTPALVPLVVPGVPTGTVITRDADGDGVPVISIERADLVIYDDGSHEFRNSREEPTGLADPDDADPDNPLRPTPPSGHATARAGCEPDAVCVAAQTDDTPADQDLDEHASAGVATNAVHATTGLRPVSIQEDAVVVSGSPVPERTATEPVTKGIPAQSVRLGSAVVNTPCPALGSVVTPTLELTGVVTRRVNSFERQELPAMRDARCLATGLLTGAVVPVAPVAVEAPPG